VTWLFPTRHLFLRATVVNKSTQRTLKVVTRRFWLVAALGAAVGCLSPTLPLPPPDRPGVEGPDSSGSVTLSGHVIPGANVYADNLATGASAGQKADPQTGQYRFKIPAQVGDSMSLFYQYDSVNSNRLYFTIPSPAPIYGYQGDGGIIYAVPDAGK